MIQDWSSACGTVNRTIETLITRHQRWIYSTVLRMVGHPEDAAVILSGELMRDHIECYKISLRKFLIAKLSIMKARETDFGASLAGAEIGGKGGRQDRIPLDC